MYYQELIELRTRFEDFKGIITPQMLVEASPIQYKTKTLEAIKQAQDAAQQAGQAQAQSAQTSEQLAQALTAVQVSQAQENVADAQEKRSQIPLNNAKTLSELDGLDVNNLRERVSIIRDLLTPINTGQQPVNAEQGA
jgi:hypothetical protein